tara:strand:+ start:1334 stop:2047 length:714 start_codon:yes stop_codon:yes gene_type:complete
MNNPIQNVDIVIPVHNEELNLKILLPKIINITKKIKNYKVRVVCIDDASSDKTQSYLATLKKKHKKIRFIKNSHRGGQTQCLKTYLKKFDSDYFIRIDGDNQDNPKHITKIFKLINLKYDLILTERKIRKHSIYMIILTFLYDKLIEFLIKKKLETYSSSLACFKTILIKEKNLIFNDHRYFPLIAIENGAEKIKVFPIDHKKRIYGKTKYSMIKKIIYALPEFLFFYFRLKKGNYS